jgi:hypothetical protein
VLCFYRAFVHFPLIGRRLFQHVARNCTHLTDMGEKFSDGGGAAGALVAVFDIGPGKADADSRPVGLQFIGNDLRHAGIDTLAHFAAVAEDMHGAVRRNTDEVSQLVHGDFGFIDAGKHHAGQCGGDHQGAATQSQLREEIAAADIENCSHGQTPCAFFTSCIWTAADRIACLIRG